MFLSPRRQRRAELLAMADEDLMEMVVHARDSLAFEIVFDRHADASFSLAYRMCGRRQTAEDVVQEAFLSVWRGGVSYDRSRGSTRAWILGVVRNRAIDTFRHTAAHAGRDVNDDGITEKMASADLTDVVVEARDEAQRVRGALSELPSDQRDVIELAYYGGFTHTEIADLLAIPPGTVKGRMRLGLAKMRITLGDSISVVS
jgi:RNA polymerase sigma-70 factor (ECF subfamily)